MKTAIILIALVTFNLQALAQDWYFAGVRPRTDTGTINKHPTKYGYSWIRKDDNKTANQKKFKADAKLLGKGTTTTFKSSASYAFVAVYKITINDLTRNGHKKVKSTYYKFYAGKDVAQIERILASDTKLYKYTSSERLELFDLKKKKEELNQQTKNPVLGRAVQ